MNPKEIIKKLSSEQLAYIMIAVIGFLSSIATLFLNVNSQVSIKWLLFGCCLYLITAIFLIRVIVEIATSKGMSCKIRIIKVYEDKGIIAVRSSSEIAINSLLSLYEKIDSYEELIGIGYVQNKQEDGVLSIKIVRLTSSDSMSQNFQKNGLIKTTLPYGLLSGLENEHE